MSRFMQLLKALDPRARARRAHRLTTLVETTRALGRRVRGLEDSVAGLARLTSAIQAEHDQLVALQREDQDSVARLASLGPGIDVDLVAAHVCAAVERSVPSDHPCPHLVVHDVLPQDLYAALVSTLPSRVLLDARGPGTRRVSAPPKLAAVATIVLWDFVVAQVVRPVLAPALAARLGLAVETPTACQLVLREPGSQVEPATDNGDEGLSGVITLARPDDGTAFGPTLYPEASGKARARDIPFVPNTLIAVLEPPGRLGLEIPRDAPLGTARYVFQFQLH